MAYVVFGSSVDNTVYALDATTGREVWRFVTDGPVRFRPSACGVIEFLLPVMMDSSMPCTSRTEACSGKSGVVLICRVSSGTGG